METIDKLTDILQFATFVVVMAIYIKLLIMCDKGDD